MFPILLFKLVRGISLSLVSSWSYLSDRPLVQFILCRDIGTKLFVSYFAARAIFQQRIAGWHRQTARLTIADGQQALFVKTFALCRFTLYRLPFTIIISTFRCLLLNIDIFYETPLCTPKASTKWQVDTRFSIQESRHSKDEIKILLPKHIGTNRRLPLLRLLFQAAFFYLCCDFSNFVIARVRRRWCRADTPS